ncbi:GTP-binding protein [Favolaschia claudopus]|uniref:GTP-binding protein n=1 Tax=Favolaschia claudopus TaxID=2862362 RepID=A0AAW0BJ70_9AGAR
MDAVLDIRSNLSHFRILILGRANAGKTTILKKVCNSIDDPEIYGPDGKEIDPSIVKESEGRGLHDIENQLIFKSNPQFIFHDSRGFESGSALEILRVKLFITRRAEEPTLAEQLHAIWYCLPTDTDRPLLAADQAFFENDANNNLLTGGVISMIERRKRQNERAREMLETNFLGPLKSKQYPPAGYVQLDNMLEKTSSCHELIETTANTIDDKALQLLFVSVQQNNVNVCIRYAIRYNLDSDTLFEIVEETLCWFPHVWQIMRKRNLELCAKIMRDKYPNFEQDPASPNVQMIMAICICAEQGFSEGSARSQGFVPAFENAMEHYAGSELEKKVMQEYHKSSGAFLLKVATERLLIPSAEAAEH